MATIQQQIKERQHIPVDFVLEFRTWNGSALVWTDYTDRLVDFRNIGSQAERNAYPSAFRMTFGEIVVRNDDGFWNDADTLDGVLVNASQPYGKKFYKRMVRISERRADATGTLTTTVIGTGLVRDCRVISGKAVAVISVISLDALASDQRADGDVVQRHPIGSSDKTTPSSWTLTDPASDTAEVALYRWREEDPDGSQTFFGWFKNRRFTDVARRTSWALDDIGTDVSESTIYTGDGREVATPRNVPPDDESISTGTGDSRARVIVWNVARSVLVVCVGHRVYDYNPVTNTYTLRNTLNSARQIVRGWYIDEADTDGFNERLVLVSVDVSVVRDISYPSSADAIRKATAYITVYDATGSGAYSAVTSLAAETTLSTKLWLGTHQTRSGGLSTVGPIDVDGVGHGNDTDGALGFDYDKGENIALLFAQRIDSAYGPPGNYFINSQETFPGLNGIHVKPSGDLYGVDFDFGDTIERGWISTNHQSATDVDVAMRWSWGLFPAMDIEFDTAGGGLWYCTWDSTNGFRIERLELFAYATTTSVALDGANTHVPFVIHADTRNPERVYVSQMEWKDTASDYSVSHVKYYDLNAVAWSSSSWLSGATGSDQAWTVMELTRHPDSGVNIMCAILYNRETLMWRVVSNLGANWSATDANTLEMYGRKDQPNRLEGFHPHLGYSTKRLFWVEAGANMLWSYDGTTLRHENASPIGATAGDPINTDRGIGGRLTSTPANYPDANTPNGMLFGVSANDYPDWGTTVSAGEYVLWQYANFYSGFIKLLDLSNLSLWSLRTLLATAYDYVHFYKPDGTFAFLPREASGAASFTFSAANNNYVAGEIKSRGYESIVNDVTLKPYEVKFEERLSDIVKGDSQTTGFLDDVVVSSNPGETSRWLIVFVSSTTYDLYKLEGSNADPEVAKVSAQSVNAALRGIPDGAYMAIFPENFSGSFKEGDNFTFWVFEPQETLERLDFGDWVRVTDATSEANYHRSRKADDFDNRFVTKQFAPDAAQNIIAWRKDPHAVVAIKAAYDPSYLPLLTCAVIDPDLGFDGTEVFQIMGVSHNKRGPSELVLVQQ